MKNRQFDIKSTKDRKEWVTQIMEIMDILWPPYIQEKKDQIQQFKKMLADYPLDKINDDVFDVDSEVLKSEKFHCEHQIKGCEYDLDKLNLIQTSLTALKEILEEEGIIDRKTNLKSSV